MKKYLFIPISCFIILVSNLSAFAQDSIYYFDINYKPVKSGVASIISIASKEDSGWIRKDYFTFSEKINQIGHYQDNEFKVKHGSFTTFYANEQLQRKGSYYKNKKMGFEESYYPNGMMSDSCKYINDIPIGYCITWYTDGSIKTVLEMDTVGTGTGIAIGYFPNGIESFKGRIAKGMRKTGSWIYNHENGNKACILKYPKISDTILNQIPELKLDTIEGIYYDSLIEYYASNCYNEQGVEQAACDFKNSLPQYKNGINGWTNYLYRMLYDVPNQFLKEKNRSIPYSSYFTINSNGKISEVLLTNKVKPDLDNIIKNIFLKSSLWIPAMHNNRIVPFMHKQSVVLSPAP